MFACFVSRYGDGSNGKKGSGFLGQWRSLAWDRAACVIAMGEPKVIDTKVQTFLLAAKCPGGAKALLESNPGLALPGVASSALTRPQMVGT
jgi:hypothetical protein